MLEQREIILIVLFAIIICYTVYSLILQFCKSKTHMREDADDFDETRERQLVNMEGGATLNTGAIVGIAIACFIVGMFIGGLIMFFIHKRLMRKVVGATSGVLGARTTALTSSLPAADDFAVTLGQRARGPPHGSPPPSRYPEYWKK